MRKRTIAAAAVLLAAGIVAAGCSADSKGTESSGNYLRVGVRTNLDNFSAYSEEADTYYGFEADLARQLALTVGYDGVEYVGLAPEERDSALEKGEVDCLIAAYSRTEERAEKFSLSQTYYEDAGRVMVERSTLFSDYGDLKGALVAVRTGTTAEENLIRKLQEEGLISGDSPEDAAAFLTIREMDTYDEMNEALEYGQVDAICADGCITLPWLDDSRVYFEEPYSTEDYVIATAKGSEITEEVDAALTCNLENGTVSQLMEKWGVGQDEEE